MHRSARSRQRRLQCLLAVSSDSPASSNLSFVFPTPYVLQQLKGLPVLLVAAITIQMPSTDGPRKPGVGSTTQSLLATGQADTEMQPIDAHAEPSLQRSFEATGSSYQYGIFATPSTELLPVTRILDTRAPRFTTTTAIPEQEVPARLPTDTSTSAPLEHRDQPFTEAATSGQEQTSARATRGGKPTGTSLQSDNTVSTQENDTPEPEYTTRISAGMTPMRLSANSSLSCTERITTSGGKGMTEATTEVPPLNHSVEHSVQSLTLQDATPERQDSTGTTAEVPPVSAPIRHRTRSSTPQSVTPNLESFFEKYRSIVRPSDFEKFRSTLGRERSFWGSLLTEDHREAYEYRRWKPSMAKQLRQRKRDILLIEDVDINCIMALDAEFSLDPQFILNYVGCGEFSSNYKEMHGQDQYEGQFHRANVGMAGSWYVTRCKIQGEMPWRSCDPSRTAWQNVPKFWDRGGATNAKRPWWSEACRQIGPVEPSTEIESKIACYCLSDSLRKLRPKSDLQARFLTHAGW
jgi:hypothetical protein